MESHRDSMHARQQLNETARRFLDSVTKKAAECMANRQSLITGGKEGEIPLQEYQSSKGVGVKRLPVDEHNILRVSIGGGDHLPIQADYVVFRGDPKLCAAVIRKALEAMEEGFVL